MRIHAYAICWNEEIMLPYYLYHYEKFVEKIIIYDNMSTDNSRQIINNHPLCELRDYDSNNEVRDDLYLEIKNNVWKECREKDIDYVIVGDIDEFLFSNNIIEFLETNKEYSIFHPPGFEMFSKKFPHTKGQIYSVCNKGARSPYNNIDKKIIFSPDRVQEIAYLAGCHQNPNQISEGPIWTYDKSNPIDSDLKLLHFKYIDEEYVAKRNRDMAKRLSKVNKENAWGLHYENIKKYLKYASLIEEKSKIIL